jgi:hypothetical protein
MTTALGSSLIRPAIFVQATFVNETVYVWNGLGIIPWNGQNWIGVGTLGAISNIEEGSNVEAKGISISMSGLDPRLLVDVIQNYQLGLPVMVWLALFDSSNNLIPSPILSFSGRMDQPTLTVDGTTCTISINCESKLIDMNVSCERRYTNDDQQLDYPGDRGFEFVNSIQEVTIYWGVSPSSTNNR